MKTNEIIKQLESLKLNQEDFIPGDDTGIFERDVKALEEAIEIIKRYQDTKEYLNDKINLMDSLLNYSIRDKKEDNVIYEYSIRKHDLEETKDYINGEVLKDDTI